MARPAAVAADGNIRVAFCTTLTTSAPTAAQCTSGTDLSFYLTPDGLNPQVDEQLITDDRLADVQTFENRGRFQYSLDKLRYVINPASAPDNAAYTTLVPGTAGYLVVRWGVDANTAWAAAQKVDIIPVRLGAQLKEPPAANSVLHATQKAFVTNSVVNDIALA